MARITFDGLLRISGYCLASFAIIALIIWTVAAGPGFDPENYGAATDGGATTSRYGWIPAGIANCIPPILVCVISSLVQKGGRKAITRLSLVGCFFATVDVLICTFFLKSLHKQFLRCAMRQDTIYTSCTQTRAAYGGLVALCTLQVLLFCYCAVVMVRGCRMPEGASSKATYSPVLQDMDED